MGLTGPPERMACLGARTRGKNRDRTACDFIRALVTELLGSDAPIRGRPLCPHKGFKAYCQAAGTLMDAADTLRH